MTDDLVEEALNLYSLGMNVLPLKPRSKRPLGDWHFLTFERLHRDSLLNIFGTTPVNLGIVCGALSRNLFVIDCDTPEQFGTVSGHLKRLGIETWVRKSPRGGHFYFLCTEGEVDNLAGQPGIDILGHKRIVMLAPSVHPMTGEILTCRKPASLPAQVCIQDLPFLDLSLRRIRQNVPQKGSLPDVADRVLVQRDLSKWKDDNSRAEYAAVLSLVGAGYSDAQILFLFQRHRPKKFNAQGEDWFIRYLLEPGRATSKRNSSVLVGSVTGSELDDYSARLSASRFLGRTGDSDKRVLMALAARARCDRNPDNFRASQRELSVMANVALETCRKALDRLLDQGYVEKCDLPGSGHDSANHYRLVLNRLDTTDAIPEVVTGVTGGHDVWHRYGLGEKGLDILRFLSRHPAASAAQIFRGVSRSRTTVFRALRKMAGCGVVCADGPLWSISRDLDGVNWDEVAMRVGTFGLTERRRAGYTEQRQQYHSSRIIEQVRLAEQKRMAPRLAI